MLPILYLFFILKLKENTLKFLAKHFSILIILSFLPYMMGLLTPLMLGYDLTPFGLDGQYGLIGPFLNPHAASISVAFSMIVITGQINKFNRPLENLFYITLIILGFYELIMTYVRTGIIVYLASLAFLYLQNINLKKILLLIFTSIILSAGSVYLIATSEVVQMRFQDKNKYMTESDLGSGRFEFWQAAVENWLDDDPSVIFIGLGEEYAKDKMLEDVGLRIFAHNEFFQTLQQEGLIGFTLFISSLILLYSFIRRNRDSSYYLPTSTIFIGMIVMMMLQGGFYFNIVLLLSIYLALLKKDYIKQINEKKLKVEIDAN
jgi:O-antigen ligase